MSRGEGDLSHAGAWVHWLLCGCWVACCCRKKSRYRAIPGTFGQFNLLVRRAGVKWVRNWGIKFLDVCLFAAAALIIGGHLLAPSRARRDDSCARLAPAVLHGQAAMHITC